MIGANLVLIKGVSCPAASCPAETVPLPRRTAIIAAGDRSSQPSSPFNLRLTCGTTGSMLGLVNQSFPKVNVMRSYLFLAASAALSIAHPLQAETLRQALVRAYQTNPALTRPDGHTPE